MSGIIGFAHRGGLHEDAGANTLSRFARALSLGAGGLEADVVLTADGVPVLFHPQVLPRRGPTIHRLERRELPPSIPSLADLYGHCGPDFQLSLDMAAPAAAPAVIEIAEAYGALDRLWLTYWRLPALQEWRRRWPQVHLVYPTLPLLGRAPRTTVQLAESGVDAFNVHHRFCTERMAEHTHYHGLLLFAWGINNRRALERARAAGVDGVYCDDVAMMVSILGGRRQ